MGGGIVALVKSLISNGAFGKQYPEMCPDGGGTIGTNENLFMLALKAEVPGIEWPLSTNERGDWEEKPWAPETLVVLDFIQFCYKSVAEPIIQSNHDYYRHNHLFFDVDAGKEDFLEKVNTIFRRNGISYVLEYNGEIRRLIPPEFQYFISTHSQTGDPILDSMIFDAQQKFLDPDTKIRKDAIERLWDCWERIKTIEDPTDKKKSISTLLDKASPDTNIRSLFEEEARKLTDIGNTFHIRHSEVSQAMISESKIIDYLFYRLFAFIELLLSSR